MDLEIPVIIIIATLFCGGLLYVSVREQQTVEGTVLSATSLYNDDGSIGTIILHIGDNTTNEKEISLNPQMNSYDLTVHSKLIIKLSKHLYVGIYLLVNIQNLHHQDLGEMGNEYGL